MIGQMIGLPIGYGADTFNTEKPYQNVNITGYVYYGATPCCFTGNMDARIVAGDDIVLNLTVMRTDGVEIDYGEVLSVDWVLKNPLGSVVLSTNSGVLAEIDDKIYLYLQEANTLPLLGNYTHEFTLHLENDSVATVLQQADLVPATFYVRGK